MAEPQCSRPAAPGDATVAWPFLYALDARGRDTGWILLNGPIVSSAQHEQFAELRRAGYRMVGTSSYQTFPRLDNSDPLDYEGVCEAWCHCFRNPEAMFVSNAPRALLALSDFTDPHRLTPSVVVAADDPGFDFAYIGGFDDWKRGIKNWSLAARCIPRLCDELDLRCLVIGTPTFEFGPSDGVTFCTELPWPRLVDTIARARFLFVPNGADPSPRIISEALCLDVPVVVNRRILGGWHYVNRFTGTFFEDERDVVASVTSCLLNAPSPREWFRANHGPYVAGLRLLRLLRRVDRSLEPDSWILPSIRKEVLVGSA